MKYSFDQVLDIVNASSDAKRVSFKGEQIHMLFEREAEAAAHHEILLADRLSVSSDGRTVILTNTPEGSTLSALGGRDF
ncbi:hypothetical protein [Arthrobacter woluwensis]|uniref:hypothetical protein n=1 Tax=Arthrobacter woluwensis TaxID=156980 RepID=UPI00382FB3C8